VDDRMSELRFDGRVAIVTGAGTNPGLGRAYAMLLASRGAKVVVNDLGIGSDGLGRAPNDIHAVAAEIVGAGGEAVADTHSVADAVSARAIVQTALDTWGRVDVLINNAGVSLATAFDEIADKDVELTIDVNLMGSVWMCRAAWPAMQSAGYGRIVNTTSGAMFGERNLTVYGAAKAGTFGLTRGLALEGMADGIRVNAVGPGAATAAAFHHYDFPEESADQFRSSAPPEAVAAVVGYLAHESCAMSGALVQAGFGNAQGTAFGHSAGYHNLGLTVEDVAAHADAIFDTSSLTIVTDPTNPASAERDTEGSLKPKPYQPT
jgi:NAD(P)-dependent dehydrogenase (short-subunit alcohol dehydrogenase family)